MARFVLQPCRLTKDRFVPTSDSSVEMGWKQLVERFWQSGAPAGLRNLAFLRPGSFIGLAKTGNKVSNFILQNDDRSGDIGRILKKDPGFVKRLTDVYRVEQVDRGSRVEEK